MPNFSNIAGTSDLSFQISLIGPVIYQGTTDPTVSPPTVTPKQGDLYFRYGSFNQIWSFNGAIWEDTATTFSGGAVAGNLDVTGQISSGDPILLLNVGEAGAGVGAPGFSGINVDRGTSTDVQWIWDENNTWWTPAGPILDVHANRLILDPGFTPALTFNGDLTTGIFSNVIGTITLTNSTDSWTMDAVGDLIPTGAGTGNVGDAANHSASIFGDQFLALVGASAAYSFIGDPDTGMRSPSGDNITFINGNTDTVEITNTGVLRKLGAGGIETIAGSSGNAGYGFASDTTSGMYINGGDLVILDSGIDRITFQAAETTFDSSNPVRVAAGAAATPGLTVGVASDGLISATNTLGLVSNGAEQVRVQANGVVTADPTAGDGGVNYAGLVTAATNDAIPNKRWVLDSIGTAAAAGAATQIQFNTGGVLDADVDFTWNSAANIMTFANVGGTTITAAGALGINSTATSGSITVNAGPEGGIGLTAGAGVGGTTGGSVTINAGSGGSGGPGVITLTAGTGVAADASPDGATVTIQGGGGDTGGDGGRAVLIGGSGAVDGGDVVLTPGVGTGGNDGTVRLIPSSGQVAPELRLEEDETTSNNNYVGLKAPATVTTSRTWVLPQDDPALSGSGNLFITDSFGILSQAHNNNSNFPIAPSYTLGVGLPAGAQGGFIYVADATAASGTGALCFFDGTNWIDMTTGTTVV